MLNGTNLPRPNLHPENARRRRNLQWRWGALTACAQRKPDLDLVAFCQSRPGQLTLAVCPDVQDPENVGSMRRISAAFGIDAVVLGPGCCDPFSRRVLRVSMGAALRIPIIVSADLATNLATAGNEWPIQLWATVADASGSPIDEVARPARLALLFGSEGHGLSVEWLQLCDRRVTIPMRPGTDSLNVAVAAGILLYHVMR